MGVFFLITPFGIWEAEYKIRNLQGKNIRAASGLDHYSHAMFIYR
jgi:hypothetical protein